MIAILKIIVIKFHQILTNIVIQKIWHQMIDILKIIVIKLWQTLKFFP